MTPGELEQQGEEDLWQDEEIFGNYSSLVPPKPIHPFSLLASQL